ncbi:MAG: HAD family phosphatase [Candidatus Levybacteria bacterium]|nr:HAD family phosphatase [Candidatus Levybacteria bacterium]
MKKNYKALMLDLDGTTIPNEMKGEPSPLVIDAIAQASKKIYVGICTGRTYKWAIPIMDILTLSGPSVVAGGALIIDSKTQDIIEACYMSKTACSRLEVLLKELNMPYVTPQDTDTGPKENIVAQYYNLSNGKPVTTVAIPDLTSQQADELIRQLHPIVDISAHKITAWKKGTFWVQITHTNATKQHGVFVTAKLLQIDPKEIIAVGDGANDFPLLMACGLKVAMGNAVPELKAIADYVAPSVEEDGVADVIEKFIL